MLEFLNADADGRSVIVVGVDFSVTSVRAVAAAHDIVRLAKNPELHLVHVVHPVGRAPALSELATATEVEQVTMLDEASEELGKLAREAAGATGVHVHTHVRVGEPEREIAQLASDVGADLVVVGTHGRSGIERVLLGSVAESVVRRAPCPVLTIKEKSAAAEPKIEPPCPGCVKVQTDSAGKLLWCERHSRKHPRAHTHYEAPSGFGVGAQTFR